MLKTEKVKMEAKERQKLEQTVLYRTVSELDEAIDDIQVTPLSVMQPSEGIF